MGTGLEYIDEQIGNAGWDFDPEFDLPPDYDDFMRDVHPETADLMAAFCVGFWQHVEGVRGIPTLEKNRIAGLLNAFASNNGIDFTVKEV